MQPIIRTSLLLAAVAAGPVMAQSKIQCSMGPNGVLEAALVWQNTLGSERANALCRTTPPPSSKAIDPPPATPSVHAKQPACRDCGASDRHGPAPALNDDEFVPMFKR